VKQAAVMDYKRKIHFAAKPQNGRHLLNDAVTEVIFLEDSSI
jgi:hypothetical protein